MGKGPQKLGTWTTLHSMWAAQHLEECLFQVTSLNLFQRVGWLLLLPGRKLVSSQKPSLSLSLSESDSQQLGLFSLGGRGLVNLVRFRDFLKNILSYLPVCLRSFAVIECFDLGGDCYTTHIYKNNVHS